TQPVARRRAARLHVRDDHASAAAGSRIAGVQSHELGAFERSDPVRLTGIAGLRRLGRFGRWADADVDAAGFAVANHRQAHRLAEAHQPDRIAELGRRLDRLLVHGPDDVADLDARRLGRRARLALADERTVIDPEPERLVQRRCDVLNPDTDAAPTDLAVLEELLDDPAHHVARYREADADVTAGRRENSRVDSL